MNSYVNNRHLDKKNNFITNIVCFTVFFSVISQLPQIVQAGYSSIISRLLWSLMIIVTLFCNKMKMFISNGAIKIYSLFAVIGIFGIVQCVLIGCMISDLFSAIFLSVFVLFISNTFGIYLDEYDLRKIAYVYISASIVVSIDLLLTKISFESLNMTNYMYASKNSISVLLFLAIILVLSYGIGKEKRHVFVEIFLIAFLSISILLMKCRAVIICYPIVISIYILLRGTSKKIKCVLIISIIFFGVLLFNNKIYNVIVENIFFNNRSHNLDSLGSGRYDEWVNFFSDMRGNWLYGDGKSKRESMILTSYLQTGVIIGTLIIIYSLTPLLYSLKKVRIQIDNEHLALFLISVLLSVNSILEQLSPFGPGMRCFYLWMLFGIVLARDDIKNSGMRFIENA